LPSCEDDLTAPAENLAGEAARVLAEAEAEVELGEELPLHGLGLGTGEAEESLEVDEPGQARAVGGSAADGFVGEEGQAEAGFELAEAGTQLTRISHQECATSVD